MAIMKQTVKYYFTVEGETEQWYLQWLQKQINESLEARRRVSFKIDIEKDGASVPRVGKSPSAKVL